MTTAYLRVILSMEILISYAPYRHQRYSSTNSLKRTAVCMVKERVCFPYEFTLLSNSKTRTSGCSAVCFPYEFTLLSNFLERENRLDRFVSPTNLHCSQTLCPAASAPACLFPLRIYTALKQHYRDENLKFCLFPLRIYTALKQ